MRKSEASPFAYGCSAKLEPDRGSAGAMAAPSRKGSAMQAMIRQDVPAPEGTQQQRLALQLIACLGRDSALHVCRVNGWAGILDAILKADDE